MVDPTEANRIVELARSELKRWGGDTPSLTHAAFVFARRWTSLFEDVFGADGRAGIESLLASQRFRGDENELRALLETNDVESAVRAIHAELGPDLGAKPGSDIDGVESAEDPSAGTSAREGSGAADPLEERSNRVVRVVEPSVHLSRAHEAAEAAAQIVRGRSTITALVGKRGVGRTTCLGAVAHEIRSVAGPMPVLRLSPDTIVANPAATLRMVLDDIDRPSVVVLDDVDLLARIGSDNPDRELLALIDINRNHPLARLVVVLTKRSLSRISILHETLHDDLAVIAMTELPPAEVAAIVRTAASGMAADRGLELDDAVVTAALAPSVAADSDAHPGLALARIDLACARATVAGASTVGVKHLAPTDAQPAIKTESHNLAEALESKVTGQRDAVERVARRLTLTRANLDLRPERPNGVFLFVGPTGVGKTELAKEIALHEYGGADRLIRLDMSEFAHDWAISRLVGPMPGYVGSTEPEGWLTTKVATMPRSVVLLDEIEKAHPRVWNTFLQVFDSGRLTDSRGVTADFSEAVVVMTSNLGVQEAGVRSVGFGGRDNDANRDRLLAVVREQMAPELLNRIDDVIVFNHLSMEAIVQIARQELDAVRSRLSAAGWSVDYDHAVADWLARTGYDPAYGARHLQRNIEREFLALLADAPGRSVEVSVDGQGLKYTSS